VERLLQSVFLAHAGSDKVAYFPDQRVQVGARLVNVGTELQMVAGEVEIRASEGTPPVVNGVRTFEITVMPGGEEIPTFMFPALPPGEYAVRTTLFLADGREGDERPVLDRITAPFRVLPDKWDAQPETRVRVKGSQFVVNNNPWRPVGVHYWPRWIAGQEVSEFKEHWLSPGQYDPQLIENDLEICEKLGINLLSVKFTAPEQAPALNDFLLRCRNRHIKVNVVLANRSATMADKSDVRELVDATRLKNNPAVFALTVACPNSPKVSIATLKSSLGEFAAVLRPYGFPISAQWDYSSNDVKSSSSKIIEATQNLDFVLFPCASTVYSLVPGQANTVAVWPPPMPEEGVQQKPIIIEGFGYPVIYSGEPLDIALRTQANVYSKFIKLLQVKNAAGVVFWWFPGGLRLDERSDFGIIGADGIPRPAAQTLKQFATRK
jgi:hypothetical protein